MFSSTGPDEGQDNLQSTRPTEGLGESSNRLDGGYENVLESENQLSNITSVNWSILKKLLSKIIR